MDLSQHPLERSSSTNYLLKEPINFEARLDKMWHLWAFQTQFQTVKHTRGNVHANVWLKNYQKEAEK